MKVLRSQDGIFMGTGLSFYRTLVGDTPRIVGSVRGNFGIKTNMTTIADSTPIANSRSAPTLDVLITTMITAYEYQPYSTKAAHCARICMAVRSRKDERMVVARKTAVIIPPASDEEYPNFSMVGSASAPRKNANPKT